MPFFIIIIFNAWILPCVIEGRKGMENNTFAQTVLLIFYKRLKIMFRFLGSMVLTYNFTLRIYQESLRDKLHSIGIGSCAITGIPVHEVAHVVWPVQVITFDGVYPS